MVSNITLETWFINSLANAGHCQQHIPKKPRSSPLLSSRRPHLSTPNRKTYNIASRRWQHTKDDPQVVQYFAEVPNRTREELLELVDQYSGASYTDQLPILELPQLYQPSDGPNLTVSDKPEDEWPPPHYAWPADADTRLKLKELDKSLKDFSKDPEEIYRLYRALPEPRAPYLEAKTRHRMLRHLAIVEYKDEHSMLRFLSVIDDMKKTAIPLSLSEWTSAISFVARYVTKTTEIEVEAALYMWREMEHIAGVKGNDATFNVLFDVACKAGKFTLAEMIYKEMENRGLKYDRYYHVSKIFFYGLRGDGDGARSAYKALVEAGEMVDTVVLNAMISALIRSQEADAAENIYERMKKIHLSRNNAELNPRDWKKRREITKALKCMATIPKSETEKRKQLQAETIMAPDLHTFRILVKYFAVEAGDLTKTAKLLDELKEFRIPLHGALFLALFQGFATHGGIRYSDWSEQRLESVWNSMMIALENAKSDPHSDLYISRWLVVWVLKAFAQCSGKSRTVTIWEEIKRKWNPGEVDMDFAMGHLRRLLDGPDAALRRHDWALGHNSVPLKNPGSWNR
jgi:pentatricopeptide repeat protein